MILDICVVEGAGECWPADMLRAVWPLPSSQALRDIFADGSDRGPGDGNCREVSLELLAALRAGGYRDGWLMASGRTDIGGHAWVEYGEWVVDMSAGKCVVARRNWYYGKMRVSRLKRETLKAHLKRMVPRHEWPASWGA